MDFYQLLSSFDQLGGFDVLLPFILVFTLVFAVLQKIDLFGSGKKNINAVVALVLSIFFLNNTYLILILQTFLPKVSIFLIIFLMFLLLAGIFAGPKQLSKTSMGVAAIVALIAILFALFSDIFSPMSTSGNPLAAWIDPGNMPMVWLLVITVLFFMFILKDNSNRRGTSKVKDFLDGIFESGSGRSS